MFVSAARACTKLKRGASSFAAPKPEAFKSALEKAPSYDAAKLYAPRFGILGPIRSATTSTSRSQCSSTAL
jgi:hypothetical protein